MPVQRRIRPLPTQLANQIAAGEVVERPASVVKELLENSLDAGATKIEISLEAGGTRLIRVVDDGYGVETEDLPLLFAPHATSKIYSLQELNAIDSFGFRGEALASIASIARVEVQSRTAHQTQGMRYNNTMTAPEPCSLSRGTRLEVRELFYNTPARKRFLRTERTEYLKIEEVVKRIALGHFELGVILNHNGKEILRLPPLSEVTRYPQRIARLFGKNFLSSALEIDFHSGDMHLQGWISGHGGHYPQNDRQYFYLNGRIIRDKVVNHAIRHAYQGIIEPGRHAAWLLNLRVDPGQVDVNVHPTKHEVRFRQGRMVHDFITSTIIRSLHTEPSTSVETILSKESESSDHLQETTAAVSPAVNAVTESVPASFYRPAPTEPRPKFSIGEAPSLSGGSSRSSSAIAVEKGTIPGQRPFHQSDVEEKRSAPLPQNQTIDDSSLLIGHFLLFQHGTKSYLSDLSLIIHQQLQNLKHFPLKESLPSKPLIFPYPLDITVDQRERVIQRQDVLSGYGFSVVNASPEQWTLQSLPLLLKGESVARVATKLRELIGHAKIDDDASFRGELLNWVAEIIKDRPIKLTSGNMMPEILHALGINHPNELVHLKATRLLSEEMLAGLYGR